MYDGYDDEPYTPRVHHQDLLDAVRGGNSQLVGSLILSRSINVNAKIDGNKTALCLAASRGESEVVRALLELNADPSITCSGLTALHYACKRGYEDIVSLLCHYASNKDLRKEGKLGNSPLHTACKVRNADCIKILCDSGASVDMTNRMNNTALHVLFDDYNDYYDSDDDNDHIDRGYGIEHAAKALLKFDANIDAKGRNGMTALHLACKRGFIDSVKFLLKNGAAINAQDDDGRTPLHIALELNQESVAHFLLDSGASVSLVNNQKKSLLHVAAQKGNTMELVRAVLSKGASINEQDNDGRTPLLTAVIRNHDSIAYYLLDSGADANLFDAYKAFPLLLAVEEGRVELIRALLIKGASINQQDDDGRNGLLIAVSRKNEEAVHCLLNGGADPNLLFDKRLAPLHVAAESGRVGIIRALVSKGASVNLPDDCGHTSLHLASSRGHEAAVQFLLENGAAVNTPDESKNSPLHVSAENGHFPVVQMLVSKHALVNEQNSCGRTPLHLAAGNNHLSVARFLLGNGASVNVVDSYEQSPLHHACKTSSGNSEIIEVLIAYGSDINLSDKYNGNALSCAITYSSVDAVKVLLRHKAAVRNTTPEDPNNALYKAAWENEYEIIKVLDSMFNPQDKNEAFQKAARTGSLDSMKVLVEIGASVDFTHSCKGRTALHYASKSGSVNCVAYLLSVGAGMDRVDRKGKTPLMIAAAEGQAEVVQHLLRAGANVHAVDTKGGSALTYACAEKHMCILRMLLEYEAGADVMCPHKDMSLLQCLYRQYIDDIMMVDIFEKLVIRLSTAGLKHGRVQDRLDQGSGQGQESVQCLVENFPDTCDWSSTAMSRRREYSRVCRQELSNLKGDPDFDMIYELRSMFPGTKITYLQALKQDRNALSHPELKTFLQPERKFWWNYLQKRYPMYGRLIRSRLQIALERDSLIDKCLHFFDLLGVTVYPAQMICEYLTNYDLRTISSFV